MILRRFISAFLALCVLVTAGMAANLRVDHGTGQFVTICAGGQSVTVELDHDGAPLEVRHHCPDCIAAVALLPSLSSPTPQITEARLTGSSLQLSQTTITTPRATARAPPLSV